MPRKEKMILTEYFELSVDESLLREQDKEEIIREQGDSIAKYRNESEMLREKLDYANKRLEAQKLYYEDQMKKLSMD